MVSLKDAVPVLKVKDVAKSIAWYQKTLGFTGDAFPPAPPHGFGILRLGDIEIMLQGDEHAVPKNPHPYEWDVYLRLEGSNIRALFAELSALGVVTRRLERMFYGQIEFEIADPDGHVLVLSQELDDAGDLPQPTG